MRATGGFGRAMTNWRSGLANPRLWVACFLTAGLFAAVGPAGTAEGLGPAGRAAFWGATMAGAWAATTLALALAESRLDARPTASFALGVLLATPALALALTPAHASILQRPFAPADALTAAPVWALLAAVIVVKTRLALGRPLGLGFPTDRARRRPAQAAAAGDAPAAAVAPDAPALAADAWAPAGPGSASHRPPAAEGVIAFVPLRRETPAIIRRLSPARRGMLLRMMMNDHYVSVATEHGSDLVLMRFTDAIAETAPEEGLRVHRSHWVARRAVQAVERGGDRVTLVLTNGERIPVSRARLRALREAGWLADETPGRLPQPERGGLRPA